MLPSNGSVADAEKVTGVWSVVVCTTKIWGIGPLSGMLSTVIADSVGATVTISMPGRLGRVPEKAAGRPTLSVTVVLLRLTDAMLSPAASWSVGATFEHHFSPQFSIDPEFSYGELHWANNQGRVMRIKPGATTPDDFSVGTPTSNVIPDAAQAAPQAAAPAEAPRKSLTPAADAEAAKAAAQAQAARASCLPHRDP